MKGERTMKKFVSAILMLCTVCSLFTACNGGGAPQSGNAKNDIMANAAEYTDKSGGEYVPCGESGGLRLSFRPDNNYLKIENTADNSVWYSSPENAGEDSSASKLTQFKMMSAAAVEYVNTTSKKRTALNLYTSNIKSGKYTIYKIKNGVVFEYAVTEVGKKLFLAAYLESGNLLTEVWLEDLEEKKENTAVCSVSVLPYFVRGRSDDSGYLFLPDGSGATVDFSNVMHSGNAYSRPIYGYEPTSLTSDYYLNVNNKSVYLPVYGARVNGSAIMAICEEGAETGTLSAEACGQSSSYANAYVKYKLLNSVEYNVGNYATELFDKTGNGGVIKTRYMFLSGENADYSGMARAYRDYLVKSCKLELKKTQTGLYADVYSSVVKKVSTLGVPHNKTVTLTSEKQLARITERLKKEGAENITVRYRSWNADELKGDKVTSADGNISAKKLKNTENARIFPAILNLQSYSGGTYLGHLLGASKSITGLPFSRKSYLLSNLNETDKTEYLISVSGFEKNMPRIIKGLKNKGFERLALGDIGNTLYCDFTGDGSRRDGTMAVMTAAVKQSAESFGELMLDKPNAYAAVYADIIYNAPVTDSGQDILSRSVPFYTMALSGISELAAGAYNGESGDSSLLYTVAAGAGFSAEWMAEGREKLTATPLSSLSNVNFEETYKDALTLYKRVAKVYSGINGSRIYSHNYIAENVSVTEYENGLKIYVNFGKEPYTLQDGTEIPAEDFMAKAGER